MDAERIHRAVSDDGTTIAGHVRGQGPPLVLVHGVLADSDLDWGPSLPFLTDRFTCYLPSTRGRGLSDDSADHSRGRLVEDVITFVDSIGEPVGLVGLSLGGQLALAAAARTGAVSAVAVYEPALRVMSEEDAARFRDTVTRVGQAAAEDRLVDAARTFTEFVGNDEEVAAVSASGYIEAAARYAPAMFEDIRQGANSQTPTPSDPSVLANITAPVLLLHGAHTALHWFTDCVHHVADHLPGAQVHEIPGAGHFAPPVQPESVADALVQFFDDVRQPA